MKTFPRVQVSFESFLTLLVMDEYQMTEGYVEERSTSISSDGLQSDMMQIETLFVKAPPHCMHDLKIEHFDDLIKDNSF